MSSKVIQLDSNLSFVEPKGKLHMDTNGFMRSEYHCNSDYSQLVDVHSEHGAIISYLRIDSRDVAKKVRLFSADIISHVSQGSDYDTILRVRHEQDIYTVWLPSKVDLFYFDRHNRVSSSQDSHLSYEWEFHPHLQLNVSETGLEGAAVVVPYIVFQDPSGQFFEELSSLDAVERHLYRKSDWFFAERPADIWNYLIYGNIYDPRSHEQVGKRFKCQQCAYAWWNYFDFLHKETGKKVYALMQDEVAFSVMLDMSAEGEWRHGFWSDTIETHSRFHLDGLHLLISQYEKTGQPMWLEAAERGMAFFLRHLTDFFDDGTPWFLHDTIENSNKSKPLHFKSTIFGKTAGNSLCINTHVQALTVLHRLHVTAPDKRIYGDQFEAGARALRRVLNHQPAEQLYKPLIFWIFKVLVRIVVSESKWKKRMFFLERQIIKKIYWLICRHFPRIVQPGGFIERDLSLTMGADDYHVTNLKDLLTLYKQVPFTWLRPFIVDGIIFVRNLVNDLTVINALEHSSYYIELIDVLYLYDKFIERVPSEEMSSLEEKIFYQTGGLSLDYYASELVRGS